MINNKTILITGASGYVSRNMLFLLPKYLNNKYNFILTDIVQPKFNHNFSFAKSDISDFKSILKVFKKYKPDIILHLAANPSKKDPWSKLLPNNIIGTYNIFELAYRFGCERVVFASSINAVNNYPEEKMIKDTDLPNPKSLYGATKVWGEALAKLYSTEKSLSSVSIRFGRVTDKNDKRINLNQIKEEGSFVSADRLISYEDTTQLIAKSIEAPKSIKFFIAHGISDNKRKRLDLKNTEKVLNYKPVHDFFKISKLNNNQKNETNNI